MQTWLTEITWTQLVAWRLYANVEPFGEERADYRTGFAFARMASMFTRKGQGFKPSDFMPPLYQHRERKPLTDRGDWQRLKGIIGRA